MSRLIAVRGREARPASAARNVAKTAAQAVAGLAQGVAVGVFVGSPLVVLYALAGGPVWNAFVRPWEEIDLEQRFGEAYRRYRAAVRCWIPRLTPYRG